MTHRIGEDSFLSTTIANPFKLEKQEFVLEDLPDYKKSKSNGVGIYHFGHSNLMPDPTLKRIVYPVFIDVFNYIGLWDLEAKKQLAKIEDHFGYTDGDPLWSPDGSDFLMKIVTPFHKGSDIVYDWYRITRDGEIEQVTRFEDFLESSDMALAYRSWDGHYLAFKLTYQLSGVKETKYIVLDLGEANVAGFCIDSIQSKYGGWLIWSPDNHYLAIANTDEYNKGTLEVVDIEKKEVYQVAKNLDLLGWISKP